MCSPAIIEQVKKRISRRNALAGLGAAGATAASGCLPGAKAKNKGWGSKPEEQISFSRVVDLSHTLHPEFPAWFEAGVEVTTRGKRTFVPPAIVEVKPVLVRTDKVNLNRSPIGSTPAPIWMPPHFSEATVDEIRWRISCCPWSW